MGRRLALALISAIAVLVTVVPQAAAEPADLVPYCTGDQAPMDNNCRVAPSPGSTNGKSGLSPNLPFGLDPGQEPAV